jgi:hypothetical protein
MATPRPTIAPMTVAASDTSKDAMASVTPLRPMPTATRASTIGTTAATAAPKAMTRMTSAATRPTASAPDAFVVVGVHERGVSADLGDEPVVASRSERLTEARHGRLPDAGVGLVEGESRVRHPAVVRDRAVGERVADSDHAVDLGGLVERSGDGGAVRLDGVALRSGEDRQGAAVGGVREALLQQFLGLRALAAGCDEVIGRCAAGGAGQHAEGDECHEPRCDHGLRSPCAGVAEATGDAVHEVPLGRWVRALSAVDVVDERVSGGFTRPGVAGRAQRRAAGSAPTRRGRRRRR